MPTSMTNTRSIFTTARFAVFAAALALAACETDGTGPTAVGAPKAEVATAKPDVTPSRTEAGRPEPKPQAAKPAEPIADSEPMTHSRAAKECWMKTEKTSAHADLDKRADLVNKCIDDKMKAAGIPAPKT